MTKMGTLAIPSGAARERARAEHNCRLRSPSLISKFIKFGEFIKILVLEVAIYCH